MKDITDGKEKLHFIEELAPLKKDKGEGQKSGAQVIPQSTTNPIKSSLLKFVNSKYKLNLKDL